MDQPSTTHQTCPLCEALCGLRVTQDQGQVTRIAPNPNDVLSRGHICPKAVALMDLHEDPDRIRTPHKRSAASSQHEPIAWDKALDEIADRILSIQQRHGRHSVAVYVGNPAVHCYATTLALVPFKRALRSKTNFSATSLDQLPHMHAALEMFGHQLQLPIPDVDHTDMMILAGANPLASGGSLMTAPGMRRRLRDLQQRGGHVVVLDPRRTETAAIADEHLFIQPGTDALFFAAMLHTIAQEDLISPHLQHDLFEGLNILKAAVKPFSPERTEEFTKVPATTVRSLTRRFANTPRAVLYGRMGVSTQRFGGLCAWLINAINIVTGHFNTPGGVLFTHPAVDLLSLTSSLGLRGHVGRWKSRVRQLPEFGGELPTSTLAEEIETPGEGQIKALITIAGNPVLSSPGGPKLARALESLDLLVCLDPYINATTRHADYILPPLSPFERDHYGIVFHALAVRNTATYSPRLHTPHPDARDDWQTLLSLGERIAMRRASLSNPSPWALAAGLRVAQRVGPERLLDLLLRTGPYGAWRTHSTHRLSLQTLRSQPNGVDLGPLRPHDFSGRTFQLAPTCFVGDLARLQTSFYTKDAHTEEFPLALIGRRHVRSNNTWLHNSQRLVRGRPRWALWVHPQDAQTCNLREGDDVRITSRAGSLCVAWEPCADLMPGVVSLPHGWGHRSQRAQLRVAAREDTPNANALTDPQDLDTLNGNAVFNGVPVRIETASSPQPPNAAE